MGFWGIFRGFFRGLECGLCHKMLFNDVLLLLCDLCYIIVLLFVIAFSLT